MAFSTPTEARDAMVAFFTDATGATIVTDVAVVYRWEVPPEELFERPSITVGTAGMTATEFLTRVRIYVDMQLGQETAQDTLDAITIDVDHLVDSRYGDSDWRTRWLEDDGLWRAECVYASGRDDI